MESNKSHESHESHESYESYELSLNDIKSMINIIDLCTSRGAFKANELKSMGLFYEKLVTYYQKKNIESK